MILFGENKLSDITLLQCKL